MADPRPLRPDPNPPPDLGLRALDNLRYIRDTMERAAPFTAVPGWGAVLIGATALAAAALAADQATWPGWLAVWLAEAFLALAIALVAMARKARRAGQSLRSGPGRLVALGVAPAFFACVPLTVAVADAGRFDLLPGLWLLLYGCGVVAGGAHSAPPVPLLGGAALLLGTAALFAPPGHEDLWMAVGFGGLHLLFGAVIARRHGG